MPVYVTLFKLTDQGIKNIKEAPGRVQEAFKAVEAMGGKVTHFYTLLGEYDYASIGEFPSDEEAAAFLYALGSAGNVRTTTMRAFTLEEFTGIVGKLP